MWDLIGVAGLLTALIAAIVIVYPATKKSNPWKKSLLVAITVLICIVITACGSTEQKTTNGTPATTQQQQEQTQPEQPSQPQSQPEQPQTQPTQQPQPEQPKTNESQVQAQPKQQPVTKAAATPSPHAPAAVKTPAPQAQKKEVTVYVTKTGEKYHRDGCRYLSKSRIPISLSDAKASGYTPCSVCGPPQ